MYKLYKNSKLRTRIILLLIGTGTLLLLGLRYELSNHILIPLLWGTAILIEGFTFHRKTILAFIITTFQLGFIALLFAYLYIAFATTSAGFAYTFPTLIALQSVTIFATILIFYLSYTKIRGKLWTSLLLGYVTFDFTFMIIVGLLFDTLPQWLTAIITLIPPILVLGMKHWIIGKWKKQKNFYSIDSYKEKPKDTKTKNMVIKNYADVELNLETSKKIRYFIYQDRLITLFTVTPENNYAMFKNQIILDGEDVSRILESYLNHITNVLKEKKLHNLKIVPIMHITRKATIPGNAISTKIYSKQYPDKNMGTVYITTDDGIDQVIKQISVASSTKTARVLRKTAQYATESTLTASESNSEEITTHTPPQIAFTQKDATIRP